MCKRRGGKRSIIDCPLIVRAHVRLSFLTRDCPVQKRVIFILSFSFTFCLLGGVVLLHTITYPLTILSLLTASFEANLVFLFVRINLTLSRTQSGLSPWPRD